MKITIGITTYNRKDLIEKTAKSLNEIIGIENVNIKIYDDCSTEYDIDYLKEKYPMAVKVVRNEHQMGADFNAQKMYEDFVSSDDQYFFNADSDLIFSSNILYIIEENIKKLEKANQKVIFSIFNTISHKCIKDFDEELCIKKSVGAAGIIMSKEAVNMFVKDIPLEYNKKIPSIDHYFCSVFRKNKLPIFCTKQSYAQHLGFIGQNSFIINVDWGLNFKVDTMYNATAIINILENTFICDHNKFKDILILACEAEKVGLRTIIKALFICIKYKLKHLFI